MPRVGPLGAGRTEPGRWSGCLVPSRRALARADVIRPISGLVRPGSITERRESGTVLARPRAWPTVKARAATVREPRTPAITEFGRLGSVGDSFGPVLPRPEPEARAIGSRPVEAGALAGRTRRRTIAIGPLEPGPLEARSIEPGPFGARPFGARPIESGPLVRAMGYGWAASAPAARRSAPRPPRIRPRADGTPAA